MPKPASASSRRPDHTEGAPKRSALAFKPRSVSGGDKGPQRSQARPASADPGARRGDGSKSKRDATSKGPAGKGTPKAKGKFPPGKGKFIPGKGKPAKVDPEKVRADRKLSKPHHELVESLVLKWNELRERKTPLERRQALVAEIVGAIRGKVNDIILRHDASRVVQGCIKCGTTEQKRAICEELYGHILRLSKSKHGYHIPERMIRHGGQPVRDRVLTELKGSVARLVTHNLGSVVVQAGFSHGWSAAQTWEAYQELYGPEYVYFKAPAAAPPAAGRRGPGAPPPTPVRSLAAVLAAHPEKRRPILLAMFQTLSKQTDKGLLSLPIAQRLLLEYLQHAPPEQVVHMVSAVRGHVLALLASRDGARAAALCFAYGAPKERKLMLRLLKGHMADIACHDHGHMVLVAALAFTDDTRTSGALVFEELRPHLAYLACHRYGRKVLLALLAPRDSRYFAPSDLEMLAPVTLPAYLAARKVETPAIPGDKEDAPAAAAAPGKKGGAAAAAPADDADKGGDAAAVAAQAGLGPRKHLLPLEPTPEQLRDAALMAPVPTSKKPEAIKARELIAVLRSDLEGVLLSRTSLLARSPEAAPVLQEAAVRLNSAELWAAIADLAVSEPSAEELAAQVAEMNAGARAASYAAQSRVRLASASAEASGAAAPPAAASAAATAGKPAAPKGAAAPASAAMVDDEEAAGGAGDADGADEDAEGEGEDEEGEAAAGEGEGDEEDDDEEEGEDEDDAEDDDDDDDVMGDGESAGDEADDVAPLAPVRLPVFEDSASHLLFKRLLHREAAPQAGGSGGSAGQKRFRSDAAAGSTAAPAPPPADAVLGRLLVQRLAGSLASIASSNRACFVILELLHSSDAAVAGAVRAELAAGRADLAGQPDCAGKAVLLEALAPAAAAVPAPGSAARPASASGKPSSAKGTPGARAAAASPAPPLSAVRAAAAEVPVGGSQKKARREK